MTLRTRHALQAAAIFCAVALAHYVLANFVFGALPSLVHWFVPLLMASMFLIVFPVWWLIFKTPANGLWRTLPAGLLIGLFWPLPAVLLISLFGVAMPGLLQLETYDLQFVMTNLVISVPFIILAALIRWRQVKGVVRNAS